MTPIVKDQLIKRFKSLGWRVGVMTFVGTIAIFLEPTIVNSLHIPNMVVLMLGLISAEATKMLNK